jgi:uncharacterized protein YdhG (YjbR/CyaY superfamily)
MKTAKDVDAYIAAQPPPARAVLEKIRALVRKAAPRGEESISYGIPTVFVDGRALIYFAGFKAHIGLFPPVRDAALLKESKPYAGPKGNLKFPLDEAVPYPLIRKIVASHAKRVAEANAPDKVPARKKAAAKARTQAGSKKPQKKARPTT